MGKKAWFITHDDYVDRRIFFFVDVLERSGYQVKLFPAYYINVLSSMEQKDNNLVNDSIPSSEVATLTAENYTNILKEVHNDIDTYVGQKISFSGYVYKVNGFSDDQFVLARDMDIGNKQTLIVGFLCSSEKAKDYKTYTWVNITGEITKGTYNNSYIPILKIIAIEETRKTRKCKCFTSR